jgi:nitrogen-specific signal transduction histidine kinase/FixJ family two-component response regulator
MIPEHVFRGTILIVDDNPSNLRFLSNILIDEGHAVRAVREGTMAITSVQLDPPDVILLDVNMPHMNGYEVCQQLKACEKTCHIPIIFISALDEVMDKVKAFEVGGVDYITRPFHLDEVLARVESQLSVQRARAELKYAYDVLETRVEARTAELSRANRALQAEIEERERAEAARREAYEQLEEMHTRLQRSSTLLQAIFDNLQDGLLLLDSSGYVQTANRAVERLLDSPVEELVGQQWSAIYARIFDHATSIHRDDHTQNEHGRTIRDGVPMAGTTGKQSQRVRYCCPDGTTRILDIQAIVLYNADTCVDQVILHMVDMTENLQLQARLIENERFAANTRLAAIVAHEVNTPLQSTQSIIGMVNDMSEAERSHFLSLAHTEIGRIGQIMRQLLNLYHPDSSKPGAVGLNELVRRIVLLNSMMLAKRDITVECHLLENLPALWGRIDQLTQVFLNLLFNAVDAMPDGGKLVITTDLEPGSSCPQDSPLVVELRDTGVGMDRDIQAHIFEPFFTTRTQGTGLGLSISQSIIAQHGGTITVQSQIGAGSTFRVVLPRFGQEKQ